VYSFFVLLGLARLHSRSDVQPLEKPFGEMDDKIPLHSSGISATGTFVGGAASDEKFEIQEVMTEIHGETERQAPLVVILDVIKEVLGEMDTVESLDKGGMGIFVEKMPDFLDILLCDLVGEIVPHWASSSFIK